MKRIAFALLLALPLLAGCSTTRLLRQPGDVPVSGKAERTRTKQALDYSVAIAIAAPPATVWALLTDVPAYKTWNSTIVSLDGSIAAGGKLALVSHIAPKRTFKLKVSEFEAPRHMVWEDGNSMFLGVRTFTLTAVGDSATTFVMSETFSGGMLGMIESKLPDFTPDFEAFAADLKKEAERRSAPASN